MSTPPDVSDPIDGRTARAVRTRDAIVNAVIELVEGGELRPTAPRIAERAGVSVRSIFQHFDDLETLFGAMGERVGARLAMLLSPIDAQSPQVARIESFTRQASALNEAVTPIRRAALLHSATSTVINQQLEVGHRFLVDQVGLTFAREVAAAGEARQSVIDTVVIASSWSTWDLLRRIDGRSFEAACRSTRAVVELVLTPFDAPVPLDPLA